MRKPLTAVDAFVPLKIIRSLFLRNEDIGLFTDYFLGSVTENPFSCCIPRNHRFVK